MLELSIKFSQARLSVRSRPANLKANLSEVTLRAWVESASSRHAYMDQTLNRDDIHILLQDLETYDVDLSRDFLEFVFSPITLVERSTSTDTAFINANTHFSDESNSTDHVTVDVEMLFKDESVTKENLEVILALLTKDELITLDKQLIRTETQLRDTSLTIEEILSSSEFSINDESFTLEDVIYVSQARFVDRSEAASSYEIIMESVLEDKSKTSEQVNSYMYNTYSTDYFSEHYTVEEV